MAETNCISWDEENPQIPLEISMQGQLESLPSSSSECIIYRVPERLRQVRESAYIPKKFSIGPLHHGEKGLKTMEELKMKYLRDFIGRTNEDLKFFINIIRDNEAKLRDCYAETIEFSSDEFVKIILVDAAFTIEVLLKSCNPMLQGESDHIFRKPWLIHDLWPDMLLLENQLPFFILEDLFGFYNKEHLGDGAFTINELTVFFFKSRMEMEGMTDRWVEIFSSKVKLVHFVHLLRHLKSPMKESLEGSSQLRTLTMLNVTKLSQAGIKFKVGSSKDLFDIQFKKGILEIPKFFLRDATELSIRNSIAFEQCHYLENHINDYVIFLTRLLSTPKDVDLLVENGILEHRFSNNKEVSILLNKLADGTILEEKNFYFASVFEALNAYYKHKWKAILYEWKANLKETYFRTPWSAISVAAATVLLVLTIVQTVCSIISVHPSWLSGKAIVKHD